MMTRNPVLIKRQKYTSHLYWSKQSSKALQKPFLLLTLDIYSTGSSCCEFRGCISAQREPLTLKRYDMSELHHPPTLKDNLIINRCTVTQMLKSLGGWFGLVKSKKKDVELPLVFLTLLFNFSFFLPLFISGIHIMLRALLGTMRIHLT